MTNPRLSTPSRTRGRARFASSAVRSALCGIALLGGLGLAGSASASAVMNYLWTGSQAIPDNTPAGTSVSISVADHATIEDLNVDIVIGHTWQGDLIIGIEKIGGPTVSLMYRPGDSQSGSLGFSANNLGTGNDGPFVFDDEAAAFYDSASPFGIGAVAGPGIADVGGSWRPYGSGGATFLSAFDGLDIYGDWKLTVSDNFGLDTGDIRQFSLHATVGNGGSVPEPSSFALAGLALAGLSAAGRMRSRKHGPDSAG